MKKHISYAFFAALPLALPLIMNAQSAPPPPPPPPPLPTTVRIEQSVSGNASVQTNTRIQATGGASTTVRSQTTTTTMPPAPGVPPPQITGRTRVEVRGWDPQSKQEIVIRRSAVLSNGASVTVDVRRPDTVKTVEDLERFVHVVVKENEDIEDARLTASSTEVKVKVRGKLFGFIPMALPARINADQRGSVEVHLPWWRWLFSTDPGNDPEGLRTQLMASTTTEESLTLPQRASFFVSLATYLQVKNSASTTR